MEPLRMRLTEGQAAARTQKMLRRREEKLAAKLLAQAQARRKRKESFHVE